jgi:HTH-type transcriptional regulator, sugar sensing transcriptional regulator
MDLHKILINIGLTEKEARVYLACLELGQSPASDIALRAKLNRVTTYDILKKLLHRGYISALTQNGIKTFSATDPDSIRKDMRTRYMDLKSALPDLRRLHGKTQHPLIRYYEGVDAVKKVYADTLNSKTEILNYADSQLVRQFWPSYDTDYVAARVKKKIYLRGIAPKDEYGSIVKEENKKSHREIRLVPADRFPFHNEINIYDDKVSIVSFGEDEVLGMIIQSQEIADTQRAIFTMAWEFSGNL